MHVKRLAAAIGKIASYGHHPFRLSYRLPGGWFQAFATQGSDRRDGRRMASDQRVLEDQARRYLIGPDQPSDEVDGMKPRRVRGQGS